MTERIMLAGAVFLYVMAIIELVGQGKSLGEKWVSALYVLIAFGLTMAWAVAA